mmetsp:Transcript_36361/g.81654  ORF Transcript_36361/g.81654 Transcript_36361/m.81654 type:complete len:204 (+) Transcript_36361:4803-5414(+)
MGTVDETHVERAPPQVLGYALLAEAVDDNVLLVVWVPEVVAGRAEGGEVDPAVALPLGRHAEPAVDDEGRDGEHGVVVERDCALRFARLANLGHPLAVLFASRGQPHPDLPFLALLLLLLVFLLLVRRPPVLVDGLLEVRGASQLRAEPLVCSQLSLGALLLELVRAQHGAAGQGNRLLHVVELILKLPTASSPAELCAATAF